MPARELLLSGETKGQTEKDPTSEILASASEQLKKIII
jgi:hypothetical protein